MANISDVYEISFECSSEPLAVALEAYAKYFETEDRCEYNLASDLTREGAVLDGGFATGRWVYSNNLEGYFEKPHSWADIQPGSKLEKLHAKVYDLLKAGETIEVSYSEDEPGCQVFQDGYGTIGWNEITKSVSVSLDFTEHDQPDCQMVANPDGTWYCEDHDHDQAEEARYCEVAE